MHYAAYLVSSVASRCAQHHCTCIWKLDALTFVAHEHAAHPALRRSMQAHLECDMLCMMRHEERFQMSWITWRVTAIPTSSVSSAGLPLVSSATSCQLGCIMSLAVTWLDSQLPEVAFHQLCPWAEICHCWGSCTWEQIWTNFQPLWEADLLSAVQLR